MAGLAEPSGYSGRVTGEMMSGRVGAVENEAAKNFPGKKPRIEYGVMTNTDLLQVAKDYFGNSPEHSWDIFMNLPEAQDAASKLLGHCGDAATQDVMNACFALEFENAVGRAHRW